MNDLHLNSAQLDALLAAEPDHIAEEHLSACATCREEFEAIRSSLTNFRIAATNIASLHNPVRRPSEHPMRTRVFQFRPTHWISGVATAVVVLAVSLSVIHRPAPAAQPHVPTAAELKVETVSDDALLQDIDRDLSNSVPTSLQPLEVGSAGDANTASSQN